MLTGKLLVDEGIKWCQAKYPGFASLPNRERAVLATAWLCDVKKPRETTGHNDGELVEAIQDAGGGTKGQSWCAYAQNVAAKVSGTWKPRSAVGAVLSWLRDAKQDGRLIPVKDAERGDLLVRDPGDGSHHIARCLKQLLGFVYSIEGNTSPGEQGSQSNGQGMYRRVRLRRFWTHAVRCD